MEPLLELRGVGKTFPVRGRAVTAVEGLDLPVGRGEFVTIVGPSGST